MATITLGGLAGVAVGGACGWGVGHALAGGGLPQLDSFAWGSLAGCFAASVFGLMYDRSVVPELLPSYRALTRHLIGPDELSSGPDYDPRERVAFFIIPLAFSAVIVPSIAAMFLIVALNGLRTHSHMLDLQWFALYFAAGLVATVLTYLIGRATIDYRTLQREIAYNTAPAFEAGKPVVVTTPVKEKKKDVPPPTAADYARMRTKGRRDALLLIVMSLGLLIFNHWSVVKEHQMYTKAVYGGPMFIMVGIFALFEPLMMYRHLPVGKYFPRWVFPLMVLALVLGGMAGSQLMDWYHHGYNG